MNTIARQFAGASYSFTRLINVEDKHLNCGLHNFYALTRSKQFYTLFHLRSSFSFFDKLTSPYFIKSPFDYLTPYLIPKVLKVKCSLLSVILKDELSCLIRANVPASSDLIRSIDNLTNLMSRRLQISDEFLRKAVNRNELSEPVQYVWYSK